MKKYCILIVGFLLFIGISGYSETLPVISVLDFETNNISDKESGIFVDYVTSFIIESRKFNVIDRQQQKKILEEMEFSISDLSDQSQQVKIGRMLSADFLLVGSIGKVSIDLSALDPGDQEVETLAG